MRDRDAEHRRHVDDVHHRAREHAREVHARAAEMHRAAALFFALHAEHERERGRIDAAERAEALALREEALASSEERRASERTPGG